MKIPGLIPPTANLSESEALERAERLRQLGHGGPLKDERDIKAKPIGIQRDPREELDNRERQPERHKFARDWNIYVDRDE